MNPLARRIHDLDRWHTEWARCRPWIEAALPFTEGTHTIEDVEAQLASGQLIMWPGERCAAITEIIEYPRKKVLNVFLAGGELDDFRKLEAPMIAFAKAHGCSQIIHSGREGWVRVLKDHGYRKASIAMVRDL